MDGNNTPGLHPGIGQLFCNGFCPVIDFPIRQDAVVMVDTRGVGLFSDPKVPASEQVILPLTGEF